MDLFGRSADEVFQRMNGVLADLLGGAGDPGLDDSLAGAGALQDQVVGLAVQIGVRGVAFAEVVAEGCAQMPLSLDLADAQDGKALRRPRPLPHLLVLAELCHHIRHVAPPFEKMCTHYTIWPASKLSVRPLRGKSTFSQMGQTSRPGQEKPPAAARSPALASLARALRAGDRKRVESVKNYGSISCHSTLSTKGKRLSRTKTTTRPPTKASMVKTLAKEVRPIQEKVRQEGFVVQMAQAASRI